MGNAIYRKLNSTGSESQLWPGTIPASPFQTQLFPFQCIVNRISDSAVFLLGTNTQWNYSPSEELFVAYFATAYHLNAGIWEETTIFDVPESEIKIIDVSIYNVVYANSGMGEVPE